MVGQVVSLDGRSLVSPDDALRIATSFLQADAVTRGQMITACVAWEYALRLSVDGVRSVEQRVKVWPAKDGGLPYRFVRSVAIQTPEMQAPNYGVGQANTIFDALTETVRLTLGPIEHARANSHHFSDSWLWPDSNFSELPRSDD